MAILGGFLMPHPPVIIPEVGEGRERDVQQTVDGMKAAGRIIASLKPETILVISPHGPVFSDAVVIHEKEVIAGDLADFGVPTVKMAKSNRLELVEKILQLAGEAGVPMATISHQLTTRFHISDAMDHGTLVPLYYVDQAYSDYDLVSISYGLLGHETLYRLGMILKQATEELGIQAVVIASGDLSHKLKDAGPYNFNPQGPVFDKTILELLEAKAFEEVILMDSALCEAAGECGKRSVDIMLGALDGLNVEAKKLSYEGTLGVGYGVVALTTKSTDSTLCRYERILEGKVRQLRALRAAEDAYVRLARKTVEHFVKTGERYRPEPVEIEEAMEQRRAGVFVSIKNSGGLRGCIGTIAPTTKSVAHEIIANAIKAASEDHRFDSITEDELEELVFSVDVLMPAEPVTSQEELDPHRYGVIVSSGYKRGLLLPNLEGIDTVHEQLRIAMSKGGISFEESYTLERFEVERHK